MAKLHVVDPDGVHHEVEAQADGQSIMSILLQKGFDVGLCSGNCSCGTCCAAVGARWQDRLPPPTPEEFALLGPGESAGPDRRLTCQLPFVEELDGIRLTLMALD